MRTYAVLRNELSKAWRGFFSVKITAADRKSTRLNSSHSQISYAVFCLKKKKTVRRDIQPGRNQPRPVRLNPHVLVLRPFPPPHSTVVDGSSPSHDRVLVCVDWCSTAV